MSVATLIQDLRRRGVVLEPAGEYLDVDAPSGVLTDEDVETLRRRKRLVLAYLARELEGRAPVVLSGAWPGVDTWQRRWTEGGPHPLACPRCGARTLRPLLDGQIGCAPCEAASRSSTASSSPSRTTPS